MRFGGDKGKVIAVNAGDVVVLPAGTGHQRISASRDLLVVGGYPAPKKYDECKGTTAERQKALKTISKVPLPAKDPIYGEDGPITDPWK